MDTFAVAHGAEPSASGKLSSNEELQLQQLLQLRFWQDRHLQASTNNNGQPTQNHTAELPEQWQLTRNITLHGWQRECVDAWFDAGRRGVLKVVTGAGKTILALAIAERLQNAQEKDLRVAIIVPTVVLLRQWLEELREKSNMPSDAIGVLGAGKNDAFSERVRILVCVLNSAAKKLPTEVSRAGIGQKLLLIVDECHRAGSAEMRQVFATPRGFSLGLSATPERDDDGGETEDEAPDVDRGDDATAFDESVIGNALGKVVFELSYADAIRRGILPPFRIVHFGLSLNPKERERYERVSREIKDLRSELETGSRRGLSLIRWCHSKAAATNAKAHRLLALTGQRKRLLYRIEARTTALQAILRNALSEDKDSRAILFHESIDEVMSVFTVLRGQGLAAVAEHSKFPDVMRADALQLFRAGTARIVVSARTLIEGFNVPSADLGIVVAASASVRQRVQTLGRLLRKTSRSDGTEKTATLYVLYAADTVDELIYEKADWEHLVGADRNEYFAWRDVQGAEPERKAGPPRVHLPGEDAVDATTLSPGGLYPGSSDEGKQYTIDTQGTIRDENNALIKPLPQLRDVLAAAKATAGRFRVTPKKRFVIKLEKNGDGWRSIYLGRIDVAPETVSSKELESAEPAQYSPGDRYPLERVVGKTFSVLQRDRRLIAQKVRGAVRFVVPAEDLDDREKAAALRAIQARLATIYAHGHQVNKITVTSAGHVVYVFRNEAYFVGSAPEGGEGFRFENLPGS